jgi:hypothetical protein
MAANSLQNATYQFGSLCWMALAALSGMAFIWQTKAIIDVKAARVKRSFLNMVGGSKG